MSETITIGSRQVPRTVVGAISRLELITAKHAPIARADVDFLRARFNEVEAQRDEAIEALRYLGNKDNWIDEDDYLRLKRPGGGRQEGIVIYSHDIKPWAFLRNLLAKVTP